MLEITLTTAFKKDLKRLSKQGKNLQSQMDVINMLAREEMLENTYGDHALMGNMKGFRECHIEPDWLLVYKIGAEKKILTLSRSGSHSEIFK